MQIIYALSAAAHATGIGFVTLIRCFLIAADIVNAILVLAIAVRFLHLKNAKTVVIAGLAANPISLFLTCQHGNFDALPVMAILCFTIALLRYRESDEGNDWLAACLALGIGVLAKSFPLFLAPLLTFRVGRLPSRVRILGGLLFATPVAVGMSVIYTLAPRDVIQNVVRYRSAPGAFGVTGILDLAGLTSVSALYQTIFPLVVIAVLVAVALRLRNVADIEPTKIPLLIAVMLTALIAFGPGYGLQYIAWPLPFFVLTFACFDRQWRRDLLLIGCIAITIYAVQYAMLPYLGSFLLLIAPSPRLWRVSDALNDPRVQTLVQLPLFTSYLWLVWAGRVRLTEAATDQNP
jgi:hypothetical protein